jgi:diguanylate cyclase
MLQSSSDAVIVHSTIDLGRNLGLRVVAEASRMPSPLQQLGLLGCHAVQGFHISRPIAPDDLTGWLEQTATPTPEPIGDRQGPTRIPRQM